MNNYEFIEQARLALNQKTLYCLGAFGAPLTVFMKKRLINQYAYNESRADVINSQSTDTFAFDCVGLVKGILWGWDADTTAIYGGAGYRANSVPDCNEATMISKHCTDVSTDMTNIEVGEFMWMPGHCGIYIGEDLVIEASPAWNDGVQVTSIVTKQGFNLRTWAKHGKLEYVEYIEKKEEVKVPEVGDVIYFEGGKHYTSANGSIGFSARAGEAKFKKYKEGAKHPYYVVHTDKTSNVYGWVDSITAIEPEAEPEAPQSFVSLSLPVLRVSTKHEANRALQAILNGHFNAEFEYSDVYGEAEAQSIEMIQALNGLEDDGIVGEKTWAFLLGL